MTYKSQTTSSMNFEGLQMKLIRKKNYAKYDVSFYGKPMWRFFNIRKLITYFLMFKKNNIRKLFSYIKNNFRKYFFGHFNLF